MTGEKCLSCITDIINNDKFTDLPDKFKESLIIMFSRVGGSHAVSYLSSIISNWKSGFGGSKDFYQKIAFIALAVNQSEKAEKELNKLAKSWKKNIRLTAEEALKRRQEYLMGIE